MILNNVTLLREKELVKTNIEFNERILGFGELGEGVDCNGQLLIPGLRNAHVHLGSRAVSGSGLGMTKYEYFDEIGFQVHDKRTDKDVYKASLLACLESLSRGVTHVDTMDMDPEPVIKALEKTGVNYTACTPLKDYHTEASDVEKQFKHTLSLKRKYDNILLGLANEYECTPELIKQSLGFAREHDLPIHMHACETLGEVKHFKKLTGQRTIQYLESIGLLDHDVRIAHCTFTDSKDILTLSEHDVPVLHCPTSNNTISDNVPPVKDMLRNQVSVRLGTDSFAWNPNTSVLREAWNSHEHTGISLWHAYQLTHEPLCEGAEASFSLIDFHELKPYNDLNDLLTKLMNTKSMNRVFLKGQEVFRDGSNLLGIDEGRLRREVKAIRKRLLE